MSKKTDVSSIGYFGLNHAVIPREDLDKLLVRMARARDEGRPKAFRRYRNRVVAANLRFAFGIARKYENRGLALEDLLSHAAIGLMRACKHFDPSKGFAFTTFAGHQVRAHVGRAVADFGRTVRVPIHVQTVAGKLRKAEAGHRTRFGAAPDAPELAKLAGLPVKAVERALAAPAEPSSLDAPIGDAAGNAWIDVAPDDAPSAEDEMMAAERAALARRLLDRLPPREAEIMRRRFGFDGLEEQTLQQIGDARGVTRERIRQLEVAALATMRSAMRPKPWERQDAAE